MRNFSSKIIVNNLVISLLFMLLGASCENNKVPDDLPTTDTIKHYKLLFLDPNYLNGFNLSSTDEANSAIHGKLDYAGTANGTPFWIIGQWNCINNDLLKATYTNTNGIKQYKIGTIGNMISINSNGTLTLQCNTSTEYGLNGITSNPRKDQEPWPTLLCSSSLPASRILKIANKDEIRMVSSYKVLNIINKMPVGTVNSALHAAAFQWFITVQNRNANSPDFGKYIWFGLTLHDNRYDFAPYYAAVDGGKINNTGAFIYKPDMQPLLVSQGKSQVGKTFNIDIDILPTIKLAFAEAQKQNFLTKTVWDDLYIGSTNIGWEVFGTYDVTVEINNFNIKYNENQ